MKGERERERKKELVNVVDDDHCILCLPGVHLVRSESKERINE